MLKGVCCLWRYTSLVDNLCLDQAVKFVLERPVVELRHRLEQGIRELPANRGTKLGDDFSCHQPIKTCHQRVLQCGWNGERGQRADEFVVSIDSFELS